MRRWIAVLTLLVLSLLSARPAAAFHHHGWGHRGWGYGGWGHRGWGYRGFGWGGFYGGYRGIYRGYGWGYPGFGYGVGYRGFGYPYYGAGYFPSYGVGYYPSYYSYPSYYQSCYPWYGAANYGGVNVNAPLTAGYPVYVSTTSAARGPIVTSIATTPTSAASTQVAALPTSDSRPVAKVAATAVQQFLGMQELRPVNLVAASPASAPSAASSANHFVARVANVETRRKAERMIAEADELFKAQNFHSALQRYKLAGTTAPDLAEAFWRQGHAFIATHNYDLAARAFKRAIALSDDLGRGGFQLSDIYGGATMTKSNHLDSLAEWAITKRNSSDAYFLLGLFLEYDGQEGRAEKFFQKAADLAGIGGGHVAMFLDPVEPVLLKSVERTVAKPAVTVPVVKISTGHEL